MTSRNDEPRRVPIACTLTANELPGRVDEWRALVRDWVVETRREPGSARLRLDPSEQALVAAVALAQREKECCAFFEFSLSIESEARWLCVTVPDDADATLDAFAQMLGTA
jgi:hypothetical protein